MWVSGEARPVAAVGVLGYIKVSFPTDFMANPVNPFHSKQRAAAFVEFCKGQTLEEISFGLSIPIDLVKNWYHNENWLGNSRQALVPVQRVGELAKRDTAAIEANRQVNLNIARKLQEELLETIDKLRKGELILEKVFANGRREKVLAGPKDVECIANTARTVADISYRALGDVIEIKHTGDQRPDAGGGAGNQITIVLPSLVATPRQKRAEITEVSEAKTVTIDLLASSAGPSEGPSSAEPGTKP